MLRSLSFNQQAAEALETLVDLLEHAWSVATHLLLLGSDLVSCFYLMLKDLVRLFRQLYWEPEFTGLKALYLNWCVERETIHQWRMARVQPRVF